MKQNIETIKKEITSIFEKDQKIRKDPQSSLQQIRAFESEFTDYLKKIVDTYGWFTISIFGEEVSYQAGILITHTQDKEFAQKCLALMEKSIEDIDKTNFALVYDKVMLSAGKPQRYGTKLRSYFDDSGKVVTEVVELEDPQNVSKLREQIGLAPLDEYIKNSEKLFLQASGLNKN